MITEEIFEGFAVETVEGLIFTVKGLVHPPERVIAYLRYLPDAEGDRQREGRRYRRVYQFEEQRQLLQTYQAQGYLSYDPVFGVQVQGVPRRLIRVVYDPCHYLTVLRKRGPVDIVEEHTQKLAELLQEAAGVPAENLGVSGSVLIGMHRSDSDIDLIVYGEAAGQAVHQALQDLMDDPAGPVSRLNRDELAMLYAAHRADTPLTFTDFARLQSRKMNEGRFRGQQYFIRFVKWPKEVRERYGDRRFELLGTATIRARIMDDREAIFTPCHYAVEKVKFLYGSAVSTLQEVVSFRGRFSDQGRVGEWLIARGNLERVNSQDGATYHRLIVGGRAGDYLLAE